MEAKKDIYYQVSKVLFTMRRAKKLSLTAYDIYMLLADRYKYSQKIAEEIGEFKDHEGRVFCLYSYDNLCEDLLIKNRNTVAKALKELEDLGLIERRRRFNASTAFYVNKVTTISNSNNTTTSNPNVTSDEKHTSNANDTNVSNPNNTTASNANDTNSSNASVYTNKNKPNKNKVSKNKVNKNNNKAVVLKEEDPLPGNKVATAIRQEIRLLIGSRKIKVERVLLLCNDIQRLKRVFNFADRYKKLDGWIIACLRDGWEPQEPKKEAVECYNAADEWLKKYSGEEAVEEEIYTTSEGVEVI